MIPYVRKRLLWAIPQLIVVLLLAFVVFRFLPGNPARSIFSGGGLTQEAAERIETKYRLNDPIPVQFAAYFSNLAGGDLGISFTSQQPVSEEVWVVLPKTATLALAAVLVGWPLGLLLGSAAAKRQGRIGDTIISSVATLLISIPYFALALLLVYLLSFRYKVLPLAGQDWRAFIMPWLTLTFVVVGLTARVARSSVSEASWADHVVMARARGLPPRRVWRRHVTRNSLIPLVTLAGLTFGELIAGVVFVEEIFLRPGIGRLAVNAVVHRDFPVLQGVILFVAVAYIFINLLVDIVYAALDPEMRDSFLTAGRV